MGFPRMLCRRICWRHGISCLAVLLGVLISAPAALAQSSASATFLKTDTSTVGSWKGVYGSDGFNVFTDTSANNPSYPSYATVTPSGNSTFQWAAPSTSNASYCLQQTAAGSSNRLLGVWYSATSFSVDLNITDGNTHQVAFYLLDWGSVGRADQITISDPSNGTVLDTRNASSFSGGVYYVYNITGHVTVTLIKTAGTNCVLSGIFFDPRPSVPAAPTGLTTTAGNSQIRLSWTASTGATSYNIYRGTSSGGEGGAPWQTGLPSTSYTDTSAANGTTYYYEATAVDANGESAKSNESHTTPASTYATAAFVKQDTSTSGSWKGVYGSDGFNV